jgi:diguanylate cyclase (GGDEF)-like protein
LARTKLIIIGGGRGGLALLPILLENHDIKIVRLVDKDTNAPAMKLAKKLDIPVSTDVEASIEKKDFDVVIDVTRSKKTTDLLKNYLPAHIEILGGTCSKIMWDLLTERVRMTEELKARLKEYEALYKIGIELASAEKSQKVFDIILKSAIDLSGIKAGSIAILDEKSSILKMVMAKGFSKDFVARSTMWPLRKNGFTANILNRNTPTIIPDISKIDPKKVNPILIEEGIKSLIAAPLRIHNKILGILYLDDYKPRRFTNKELAVLNLLATQATIAIEKMHLLERVEHLAITDELTQLYNYRHFFKTLSNEVSRAARYKHPLSLMIIDIDNFKKFNDSYGHPRGNFILSFMSEIFKKNVRNTDTIARYGGEEFVVVSPESDKQNAHMLAERIRKDVEMLCRPEINREIPVPVTISIGLSSMPDDASDGEWLIKNADEMLYQAKQEGKNKVCCL